MRSQQVRNLVRRDRATEVETLPLTTAMRLEEGELLGRFDPFCHNALIEAAAHADDGVDDGRVVPSQRHPLHE
jgi:hypothetical protein